MVMGNLEDDLIIVCWLIKEKLINHYDYLKRKYQCHSTTTVIV